MKYGEEQVLVWRRSYDVRPPALTDSDSRYPGGVARYQDLTQSELPFRNASIDTVARFLPYWHQSIAPVIQSGKRTIINTRTAIACER